MEKTMNCQSQCIGKTMNSIYLLTCLEEAYDRGPNALPKPVHGENDEFAKASAWGKR